MLEFFQDGGWPMYPILAVGLVLLYASTRYALDREPVRLRFVTVLTVALLVTAIQGFLCDVAKVLWLWATWTGQKENPLPEAQRATVALLGAQECTTTLIFGLGLSGLALILVAIGTYRTGERELQAAKS